MSKKIQFRYLLIKLIVYATLAVFIFIFREGQVNNLKPFIGALMILYGLDGIAFEIICHLKGFIHSNKTYLGLVELIFGIVLAVAPIPFNDVCIIWATWSIIRESYELKEIVSDMKKLLPRLLSLAESITVIVLSIMLLLEPGYHHALIHMILLTAELIINPLVIVIDELLVYRQKKKEIDVSQKEE